jgi:hypothetical protein
VSIGSAGYDGTVDEVSWATLAAMVGSPYNLYDPADFAPSIGGAGARAVTIQPGKALGWGVLVTSTVAEVRNATSLSSGVRWDTLVLNRKWGTNASDLIIRAGTSSQALAAGVLHTPGTEDDQPIALLRIDGGSADIGAIIDLRTWSGKVLQLPQDPQAAPAGFAYPHPAGQIGYTPDGHRWRAQDNGSGTVIWVDQTKPIWKTVSLPSSVVADGAAPAVAVIGGVAMMRGAWKKTDGTKFFPGGGTGGQYSLGNLPAGSRPGTTMLFPVNRANDATATGAYVQITAAGLVTGFVSPNIDAASDGSTSRLRADGITFPAEN